MNRFVSAALIALAVMSCDKTEPKVAATQPAVTQPSPEDVVLEKATVPKTLKAVAPTTAPAPATDGTGESVYFSNGMLMLIGRWPSPSVAGGGISRPIGAVVPNEMSVKPDATGTKLWGRVNDFNYSLPAASVKSIVILSNKNDKVWVDVKVKAPVAFGRITPINDPTVQYRAVEIPLLSGFHSTPNLRIRTDMVSAAQPFAIKIKNTDGTSTTQPCSSIELVGWGKYYSSWTFAEMVSNLAASGWGYGPPKPFVVQSPTTRPGDYIIYPPN